MKFKWDGDLSREATRDNNSSKEGVTIGLQHHSQIQGMATNIVCYWCSKGLHTKFYIFKGEILKIITSNTAK